MVGELRCLNCSRHLADVVDGGGGRMALGPPAGQSAAPILVKRGPRGLHCGRCGGRALVEQTVGPLLARPAPAAAKQTLTPAA